jgi:uncharacterized protein YjbJ (UPF0337 family)
MKLGTATAALLLAICSFLIPLPAMALASGPVIHPIIIGTMSNKSKAAAKDAEGKLEAAYGELTDDKGHQLKGKAKQVQASAMNAAEDIKEGAEKLKTKLSNAVNHVAEDLS